MAGVLELDDLFAVEQQLDSEQLLASAASFLIDGGEDETASLLLSCSVRVQFGREWMDLDRLVQEAEIYLAGPRAAYDALQSDSPLPHFGATRKAFEAVLPLPYRLAGLEIRAAIMAIAPGWRAELLELARGRGIHNQVATGAVARTWCNLNFRSQSEIRIAQALDRTGALVVPNCRVRVSSPDGGRLTREPDFIVCKDGKWGILEVDGEPFHPPTRTVHDHKRDELFLVHGIPLVRHYDADECYNEPEKVVQRFLTLLERTA